MSDVFGRMYADTYDIIYREKDYDAECRLIQTILDRYCDAQVSSILDLGCGTGSHALRLAAQGYQVTGVDRSERMLAIAQEKAESEGRAVTFSQGDIRSFTLGETFDAAIVMFAVLGYQTRNDDLLVTLRNIRKHLKTGGLLIFDVWYGPAVLTQKPEQRVSVIEAGESRIIRLSSGVLDTFRHVCSVDFHVFRLEGKQLVDETREAHEMRFFFPQEIGLMLESAGFEMVHMGPFPEFEGELSDRTWNVVVVGRGVCNSN